MKNTVYHWLSLLLLLWFSNCALADTVQDQIDRFKDQDWRVCDSAVNALGKMGKQTFEPLIACLKDQDPKVRHYAAEVLGKLDDERAVEPLIACLKDQDAWVREGALDGLGELDDTRAMKPLIACFKDPDYGVRTHSLDAFAKLGKPAVEPLIGCLKDQEVRIGAAYELGQLGDARAVGPLIACLEEKDYFLRESAAEALGKLGDARAVEPLIACLREQDYVLRDYAATALGKLGKPAFEPLMTRLKDKDLIMREGVFDALGKSGDPQAVEPLIACLKNQDPITRRLAAGALGSIKDEKAMYELVQALPDWDCKEILGSALKNQGWKPKTDADHVYFWICNADGVNLKTNWKKTTQVLLADMQSGDQRKIENAVYTFVSLGREEIIPQMIAILNTQGTKEMAVTFLNCGRDDLENAASSWASVHGYQITNGGTGGKASWGKWH